ncbi:hypothetical protein C8T65DRAFT_654248 [Cerioporus squamosus]|nr:hypothetical protein C8T65DRAFT_654248 [Cerioporus squamosus]
MSLPPQSAPERKVGPSRRSSLDIPSGFFARLLGGVSGSGLESIRTILRGSRPALVETCVEVRHSRDRTNSEIRASELPVPIHLPTLPPLGLFCECPTSYTPRSFRLVRYRTSNILSRMRNPFTSNNLALGMTAASNFAVEAMLWAAPAAGAPVCAYPSQATLVPPQPYVTETTRTGNIPPVPQSPRPRRSLSFRRTRLHL